MKENLIRPTRLLLLFALLTAVMECCQWCRAESFVLAPTPGTTYLSNALPFLVKDSGYPSLRYQQVYNSSLFTNVDPACIYVTTMTFYLDFYGQGAQYWVVTNMQISLSTTSNRADHLSPVFSENVGADDTVVFGPGSFYFPGGSAGDSQEVPFTRPFRYDPTHGNLLLDVRIFVSIGAFDSRYPTFEAYSSTTDQCSRVWAPAVNSLMATNLDSIGLFTTIQLSPIPSLTAQFFPAYGSLSNITQITWPPQPSVFRLQRSDRLGLGANWRFVTNGISGSLITVTNSSAGTAGFYRLIWTNGYGAAARCGGPPAATSPPQPFPR
ncbi:MAG TPA: hypothetical protein VG167_14410 [Verrucomicrobiae bacterium]|nr:hypothetical protein [Verrucomicrobiae bacterium]